MVTDASSSAALRHALDQLAATGHELAIIGFGAKGWCGMCDSQLTNETFRQWLTGEVAYAKTKGLLLSGYTLMQVRAAECGWSEAGARLERGWSAAEFV